MKGKSKYIKIIPVILILIAFIFITDKFQEKERSSFAVDKEKFDVAENESELKEKLSKIVPNYNPEEFELIDKYDLMTEIDDVEVNILEEQRKFRVDSVWNEDMRLLVTYSLDLSPFDEDPEDIPFLKVNRLAYHLDGKEPFELAVGSRNQPGATFWHHDGVVYKNRLYRRTWLEPEFSEKKHQEFSKWIGVQQAHTYNAEAITNINKFELGDIQLIQKTKNNSEKSYAIDDLYVNYDFKSWNPLLEKKPINETVTLRKDSKITFTDFEMRLHFSQLNVDLDSPYEFTRLNYKYNDHIDFAPLQSGPDGQRFIGLPHYQQMNFLDTEEINLKILGGSFPTDEELSHAITPEDLKEFRNQIEAGSDSIEINREIGQVNGIEFKLTKLGKNVHGPREYEYGFFISIKANKEMQNLHLNNYTEFLEFRKENPDTPFYGEAQAFYEVTDQNGKSVKSRGEYSHWIESDEDRFAQEQYFGIEKEDFDQLDEINIRLLNIPRYIEFDENELTVNLKN
ncbi:hypothetical protein ACJROX_15765 [Pseudalkalibacillus sp. A8]|uniref:hypothetical protein n=1 Tax=Pseudalkalibacillus sp. A8 TaxID=3382641 RepID=UPI0038B54DB3